MQPSSWIWPNSADAKQGINLKWRGGAGRVALAAAAGGAVTKMNGVIPAAQMVISLFVTVAPSKSDSVGASERDATKRFAIPSEGTSGYLPVRHHPIVYQSSDIDWPQTKSFGEEDRGREGGRVGEARRRRGGCIRSWEKVKS